MPISDALAVNSVPVLTLGETTVGGADRDGLSAAKFRRCAQIKTTCRSLAPRNPCATGDGDGLAKSGRHKRWRVEIQLWPTPTSRSPLKTAAPQHACDQKNGRSSAGGENES
jgi:hypothetical protein